MRRRSVRDFPAPRGEHFGQYGWCKWCDQRIPEIIDGKRSTQRLWHPECAAEYNLHTRLPNQFDFVAGRDGEHCALCPPGTPTPMRWLAGPVMTMTKRSCWGWRPGVSGWWDIYPDPPEGRWADMTPEERQTGAHQEIERVGALQVDHRVPLWATVDLAPEDRRPFFGPPNLWLLCPDHHKAKTRREAALRASFNRLGNDGRAAMLRNLVAFAGIRIMQK